MTYQDFNNSWLDDANRYTVSVLYLTTSLYELFSLSTWVGVAFLIVSLADPSRFVFIRQVSDNQRACALVKWS